MPTVIYHDHTNGTAAADEVRAIWSSRTSGPVGVYFLELKSDGNLSVYPGVRPQSFAGRARSGHLIVVFVPLRSATLQEDGTREGECIWKTRSKPQTGQYHMVLQDDGKLAIYRGIDPEHSQGLVRRMRPRYSKKAGHR